MKLEIRWAMACDYLCTGNKNSGAHSYFYHYDILHLHVQIGGMNNYPPDLSLTALLLRLSVFPSACSLCAPPCSRFPLFMLVVETVILSSTHGNDNR